MTTNRIEHIRQFKVHIERRDADWPDLHGSGRVQGPAIRLHELHLYVDIDGSGTLKAVNYLNGTGRNIRKDGTLGAVVTRGIWDEDWTKPLISRALAEIVGTDWAAPKLSDEVTP